MPKTFLDLPSEVRNDIYERLLVFKGTISCSRDAWEGIAHAGMLTSGLLLASKKISSEATSILYAQNYFDFKDCASEELESFLKQIGEANARFIRHIIIDFPEFCCPDRKDVAVEPESAVFLEMIRTRCFNLKTITTSLYSTNAMQLRTDAIDCPNFVTKAIALANYRFRSIPSLQEVFVKVYEDEPMNWVKKEMEDLGWTLSQTEHLEYSDSDLVDGDSDEDIYDYDDTFYDDDEFDAY